MGVGGLEVWGGGGATTSGSDSKHTFTSHETPFIQPLQGDVIGLGQLSADSSFSFLLMW